MSTDHKETPDLNPPSYIQAAPQPTASPRAVMSITDLRNQIIANATVLFPSKNDRMNENRVPDLVVAKYNQNAKKTGLLKKPQSEKEALARVDTEMNAQQGSSTDIELHYAMILRHSYSKTDAKILLKGAAKPTVEAALLVLLDHTERGIHALAEKHGRDYNDGECRVM